MQFTTLRKWLENRFTHLFGILIVIFLFSPLLEQEAARFPMRSLVFMCAVILMLRAIYLTRPVFILSVTVAVSVYILDVAVRFGLLPAWNVSLHVITLATYAVFTVITGMLLAKDLFAAKKVTQDTIMGGICLYFNIGFLWALFYGIMYYFDKDAFGFSAKSQYFSSFYFSFTTLTTLGYGDIWPQNGLSRVLSNFEAILGQVYLAVFIARLVALHVMQQYQRTQGREL